MKDSKELVRAENCHKYQTESGVIHYLQGSMRMRKSQRTKMNQWKRIRRTSEKQNQRQWSFGNLWRILKGTTSVTIQYTGCQWGEDYFRNHQMPHMEDLSPWIDRNLRMRQKNYP